MDESKEILFNIFKFLTEKAEQSYHNTISNMQQEIDSYTKRLSYSRL
ncbi:hypothetical protein GCM10007216_03760 [Thalassobacillus devorans]|uniref:Uncharacterized protein n=1 Tax=Thalassobacillus devorans TaxID=279813 RepID=A0ABQ1NJW4_9BACI|nr:hypothetical protein GCM10007216_03760 [Thalassobacillus devorans]